METNTLSFSPNGFILCTWKKKALPNILCELIDIYFFKTQTVYGLEIQRTEELFSWTQFSDNLSNELEICPKKKEKKQKRYIMLESIAHLVKSTGNKKPTSSHQGKRGPCLNNFLIRFLHQDAIPLRLKCFTYYWKSCSCGLNSIENQ